MTQQLMGYLLGTVGPRIYSAWWVPIAILVVKYVTLQSARKLFQSAHESSLPQVSLLVIFS